VIGVDVVEDVQLRHQVVVLREVEQAAMGALHALDPVVMAGGRLRLGELRTTGDPEGGGSAGEPGQETATVCLCSQKHRRLLHVRKEDTNILPVMRFAPEYVTCV